MKKKQIINSIKLKKNEVIITLINMPDRAGIAATIFGEFASRGININLIVETNDGKGHCHSSFTINKDDLEKCREIIEFIQQSVEAEDMIIDENIAIATVIGTEMAEQPGIAADIFRVFADENISIKMVSTSETKILCALADTDADRAYQILNDFYEIKYN